MHKWQQRQRKKIHQSIIQNAKPTIKLTEDLLKSRQRLQMTISRTKQLYTPSSNRNHQRKFSPFVKILELFQLQKYSSLLIQNGFPHRLNEKKSMKFIDDMLEKVQLCDQEKFLSLMNTLVVMSKDLMKNLSTNNITPNNFVRKGKSSRMAHNMPPQPTTSGQLPKPQNNLTSLKKTEKSTTFKVRQASTYKSPFAQNRPLQISSKFSLTQKSKSIQKTREGKKLSSQRETLRQNQISQRFIKKTPKKTKALRRANDDSSIIHNFKNSQKAIPTAITASNRIMQRLMQRLKKLNPHDEGKREEEGDVRLQVQRIKKMYLSFDSVRLTSNIGNLDLEEMIDCFVEEIGERMDRGERSTNVTINRQKNRTYRNQQSHVENYIVGLKNKEEIEFLLKESLVIISQQPIVSQFNPQSTLKPIGIQQVGSTQDVIQYNHDQTNHNLSSHSQQAKSVSLDSQSDLQSEEDFEESLPTQDFACFDDHFLLDNSNTKDLGKQDIKNFIQLVMMAGKMEKEVSLIAYIYMKKLLSIKSTQIKPKLTLSNWKNIILVTLISASKIWDDTSLQNHSFSKVLKPYTTYEINRLEKHFLLYIDYKLTINQQEYCQGYFQLRRHSCKANKTAHLMSLDLRTILKLEEKKTGVNKKEVQLKEYYRKKMDRSF